MKVFIWNLILSVCWLQLFYSLYQSKMFPASIKAINAEKWVKGIFKKAFAYPFMGAAVYLRDS